MSGLPKIYVDFNNRVNPKLGVFFKVDLEEIRELDLLDYAIATDLDELELEVVVVARHHDLEYGIVQLSRVDQATDSDDPQVGPRYSFDVGPVRSLLGVGRQNLVEVA